MADANDFLMRSGAKSATFPTIGTTVKGVIAREPELSQQRDFDDRSKLKFWDTGEPMMQVVVILATAERDPEDDDDNGERGLYLRGNILKAVQVAVKEAKAKGLAVGGKLAVKYSGDGDQPKKGLAKPKLYKAAYEAPDPMAQAEHEDEPEPVAASAAKPKAKPAQAEPEDDGDDLKF